MKRRVVAGVALFTAGLLAGIVFEHYHGSGAVVDWAGLRYAVLLQRVRPPGDRSEVAIDSLRGKRLMVALAFGQSNAADEGETPGAAHPAVYEFYRGKLYAARDPLLGAEGKGGSVWLRFAAKAVDSGAYDAVVLVPFAFGASEIARWAPGGSLHDALLDTINRARASGLRITHLLWHQGEADAERATAAAEYRQNFLAMLAAIRRLGVDAPVHVAVATRCGWVRPYAPIRDAQIALRDAASGILAGPDTDRLGFAERYDGCHFSAEGLDKAAELWWEAVRPGRGN